MDEFCGCRPDYRVVTSRNTALYYRILTMNPINKALGDLKFKVPKAILELAFLPKIPFGAARHRSLVSLDYSIREAVIEAIVLVDCNLSGGVEITVPLVNIRPEYAADYKVIWRIPLEMTQNRPITRVYSLIFGRGGVPTLATPYGQGLSALEDAAKGLLTSQTPIPQISIANIQLIGENVVMAHMNVAPTPQLYLRCRIENDPELNNLPPTSVLAFSKLVEYAAKAYIYNLLYLDLDRAELAGGSDLGRFTSIIESYADSETLYQEYFADHFRKILFMSDTMSQRRYLKAATGGLH